MMNVFCYVESKMLTMMLHDYFSKASITSQFFDKEYLKVHGLDLSKPDFVVVDMTLFTIENSELVQIVKENFGYSTDLIVLTEEVERSDNRSSEVFYVSATSRMELADGFNEAIEIRKENLIKLHDEFNEIKKKKRVLVVDDSELHHEHLKNIFMNTEFELEHAFNGEEAIALVNRDVPSLIITDFEMPKMNGVELCSAIRKTKYGYALPIILGTSYTSETIQRDTFNAGADDFICKPFVKEELLNKVNSYFGKDKRIEKILIVDDSEMIRKILQHALVKIGYTVIEAKDGVEGYNSACKYKPDIIVTDLTMDKMSGYEMIEKIRQTPAISETPCLVVSSMSTEYDKKLAEKLGISKYFVKPFKVDYLLLEIEHLFLEKYRELALENEFLLDTINTLICALEARDKYTQGHSERVTRYACLIAEKMNLDENEIKIIEAASKLHDIGKIGIRDELLLKPSKLSELEFNLIKNHTIIGKSILGASKTFREVVPIMYYHHERVDGKGYPEGLSGEDIPLGARIIAVADSFDAMTSNRPYRNNLCVDRALKILIDNVDTQFCRKCVEAFLLINPERLNRIKMGLE
ncbi:MULTISPECIES: response regulator [unclassified Fusibacter]|uniref:response regulator n=1 Tax=unclassified Fusibacter TaxID=2624464 RepID=UPI0010133793|nr:MULTISPECIES: response regulator [unclassified Fusibacter]MCK8058526.1 response regulator [Fusibacter sp. A2]NPE22705.1 response regulator [Fusibacter sp. A1]RXV60265.1 response regulator [Fusibacter sp. A1]